MASLILTVGLVMLMLCSLRMKTPENITGIRRLFWRCAVCIQKWVPCTGMHPKPQVLADALAILAAGSILAVSVSVLQEIWGQNTVTSLEREGDNGNVYWETLQVQRENGKVVDITVEVPGRQYTEEETEEWLDRAEKKLDQIIQGENESLDRVERPLNLVREFDDLPVSISWISSNPAVLDWEGVPQDGISEKGAQVKLYATLTCQETSREREKTVTVYPESKYGDAAWEQELYKALKNINADSGNRQFYLPQKISGEAVVWKRDTVRAGGVILIVSIVLAAVWIFGRQQEEKQQEQKIREQMMTDYPDILNKFTLLLNAGMNTRKAFSKVALDYKKTRSSRGENAPKRAAYEAISAVYQEMEQGVPEAEAYAHLGIKCQLPAYKTLSTLLVQNLRKGSGELLEIMEREAVNAFENRKRRAKVIGEQAGTKLLLPMVLMLIIVFAVLLVPAGMSFL
ncbi:type II secretion system F family protein [Ruminococcus sp. OA3]|uniref:type II secretion system F family protein n=1 Tax=Ruminococcus sp. OA3 TaxID=2914164 RepID=UPI001F069547|nr:type II secretion system F family protein [Ruminococcus sp. OA3]MCH1981112.1 type II secretion system F family protein [Ruminococcus sp. OA3]